MYKMHNKKSQSLPINIIIIAAIVLVVIFVLMAVFTGRFGIFSKSMKSCGIAGGECADIGKCNDEVADYDCPEKKECCISSGGFV